MSVERLHWSALETTPGVEIDVNAHVLDGHHASHDHDFVEVAIVLDGAGLHQTLYDSRALDRGDAFVIRPGAWHAFHDCRRLRVVNCCFQAHLLDRELLWLADEPRLRLLLWPSTGVGGVVYVRLPSAGLQATSAALDRLNEPPATPARPPRVAQLLLLLSNLAGHLDRAQLADAERLAGAPEGVMTALRLLGKDIAHAWSVDELAAEAAVSPSHLFRLFRQIVGESPMAHLTRLRAEAAAQRLLIGAEPVSVIGAAVGWGDPNHFARRFRAHFDMSPTAFRRRAQLGAGVSSLTPTVNGELP
jgi:AraC family transcriptional regulator, L-rhamnose operon transcriptional activator RhaR